VPSVTKQKEVPDAAKEGMPKARRRRDLVGVFPGLGISKDS
jgi:hypothetical protein